MTPSGRSSAHCRKNLARRSVTFDNGSEFALHQNLNMPSGHANHLCDPHSPWQRGTIENTNGLLRRDMPRKTNLHDYTARDIDDLTWAINAQKTSDSKSSLKPSSKTSGAALDL